LLSALIGANEERAKTLALPKQQSLDVISFTTQDTKDNDEHKPECQDFLNIFPITFLFEFLYPERDAWPTDGTA
jgi:hypothetical protein